MVNAVAQSKTQFDRRVFAVLTLGGLVGIAAVANLFTFILPTLPIAADQPPPPALVLWGAMFVQYGSLLALSVWGGMVLATRMNKQPAPFLTAWLNGEPTPNLRVLWLSATVGVLGGLGVLATHEWVFAPITNAPLNFAAQAPPAIGLSAAFLYGGITEELLMRLGLLTLLVWVFARAWRAGNHPPTRTNLWLANGIVTVLFALGHLPAAALSVPITPLLVLNGLVLNSIALLFGWLYWHKGIEAAIVCHMCFHVGYTVVGTWV